MSIHRHPLCLVRGAYILASTCAKGAPCAANTGGLHGWGPKSFGSWLLSPHCLHLSSYVSFVLLRLEGKDARTRYSNAIGQLAGNIFNILQHYYRLYRQLLNETFVVLTWISSTWRNKSVVSNGFSHRFILRLHHCFYQQPVA